MKDKIIGILTCHFGWQRKESIEKATKEIAELLEPYKLIEAQVELIKGISENVPELNMANYSLEQVRQLNDAMIDIYLITHKDHEIRN